MEPQQLCLGQGWEGVRRRRPCSNTSRGLSRRSRRNASSALWSQSYLPRNTAPCAQPAVRETLHVRPRRPYCGKEESIYIYIPSRPAEGNNIYRPVRGKKYLQSRPRKKIFTIPCPHGNKCLTSRSAEGKENYRPVPPKENKFTVPSRREIIHPLSLPVPPLQLSMSLFYRPVPFSFFPPAKQVESVSSRPVTIPSHCDKPWYIYLVLC